MLDLFNVLVVSDDGGRPGIERDGRAVTLTTAGLEDDRLRTQRRQGEICGLVPAEPVVLVGQPRHGPFACQWQLCRPTCADAVDGDSVSRVSRYVQRLV